jgi:hypothetical protein
MMPSVVSARQMHSTARVLISGGGSGGPGTGGPLLLLSSMCTSTRRPWHATNICSVTGEVQSCSTNAAALRRSEGGHGASAYLRQKAGGQAPQTRPNRRRRGAL